MQFRFSFWIWSYKKSPDFTPYKILSHNDKHGQEKSLDLRINSVPMGLHPRGEKEWDFCSRMPEFWQIRLHSGCPEAPNSRSLATWFRYAFGYSTLRFAQGQALKATENLSWGISVLVILNLTI